MIHSLPRSPAELADLTSLILGNHRQLLGRDLLQNSPLSAHSVEALFFAPRVVLAAFGPFGNDHAFVYANALALDLFESTWDELVGQPSSTSAEPVHRDERRRLLDEVGRRGFIEDYSGIRISRRGRRFRICQATVFNLLDPAGAYLGQAATFAQWEPCTPDGLSGASPL